MHKCIAHRRPDQQLRLKRKKEKEKRKTHEIENAAMDNIYPNALVVNVEGFVVWLEECPRFIERACVHDVPSNSNSE